MCVFQQFRYNSLLKYCCLASYVAFKRVVAMHDFCVCYIFVVVAIRRHRRFSISFARA